MDKERQIRFLYPPLFLLASLAWGLYLDPSKTLSDILPVTGATMGADKLIGVIAAGGTLVLVFGFLIGAISVSLLRLAFCLFGREYEVVVSDACLDRIWAKLRTTQSKDTKQALYAGVTFDHELLSKGVHDWLTRRWHAFNISAHSCVALLLAHGLGWPLGIQQQAAWLCSTGVAVFFLVANAVVAWRETMGMIEFQSYRSLDKPKRVDKAKTGDGGDETNQTA